LELKEHRAARTTLGEGEKKRTKGSLTEKEKRGGSRITRFYVSIGKEKA